MNRTTTVTLTNMCMVYDDKGNVLVEEKAGGLIFPGGHVENGESIVASTSRDIKEETGLVISDFLFCGIKDWLEKDGSRYLVFYTRHTSSQENSYHPMRVMFIGCP